MTYGNATAIEIAKYHIEPDVIAQHPVIEEWAATFDAHVHLADATNDLRIEILCDNVLDGLEMFVERLPNSAAELTNVRAVRSRNAELAEFFEVCDSEFEDRTLDVSDSDDVAHVRAMLRLGIMTQRMRDLREIINAATTEDEANSQEVCDAREELNSLATEIGMAL